MSEELYNSVSLFDDNEEIKNKYNVDMNDRMINLCDTSTFGDVCNDKPFYRKCLIANKYLTHLKSEDNPLKIKGACKYLSYWLYKEMTMDNEYNYSVSKIHENIMKINNVDICKDHVEDISPVTFLDIDNLNKLHQNFMEILRVEKDFICTEAKLCVDLYNSLEKTCYLNSDDLFCKGIEKFRKAYNETMERKQICAQYKILPPFQKRLERSANTIPAAAITAITFASIMTYKFTPLGSWLRHRLSGNKNLRNKLEKELNVSQNSSELQDMEYRVPYNSS